MSVRTRFAPSPSGDVHVGNIRTALVNWLFAKKHGGTFVFRIEDTDAARSDEKSIDAIVDSLKWLSLEYDEGPDKDQGRGPYQQSQRLEIYRTLAEKLVDEGKAYYCFSTPEELEALSKRRMEGGAKEHHSDRDIPLAEAKERAKGGDYVIRFIVDGFDGELTMHDEVRGDVAFAYKELGDFNLIRADGRPMYNFAAAVDDHAMEITHVIRGEDGLSNTPRQILLYQALGYEPPKWAHLPLILGPDGGKLSKRHGDTAVGDFRRKGYLPESLLNYLGLLGIGGFGEGSDVHTLEEMIANFSFENVVKKASVFDYGKLDFLNTNFIQSMNVEELVKRSANWLNDVDESVDLMKAAKAVQGNITTLAQIGPAIDHLANGASELDKDAYKNFLVEFPNAALVWKTLDGIIEKNGLPAEPADIKALFKEIQNESGEKGKMLFMPVRFALTGEMHGPDLPLIMDAMGADGCRQRLSRAIDRVK